MSSDRRRLLRAARFALHLITVALVVVTTVRAVVDGAEVLPAALAAGGFLAWYGAGAAFAHGRAASWWLVGLGAIWTAMLALSPEFVWLSFPLLLLAGHVLTARWSALFAAVVLAAAIVAPHLHGIEVTFAHLAGPLLGGGFALAVSLGYDALLRDAVEREELIASLLRAQQEMAELQDELARTQRDAGAARERTRLARDLHDTIAQELSSVSLLARGGDADRMPQIDALAQHSLTELRRIVAALAPAELEGTALAGALQRLLDALAADTGIRTELDVDEAPPALPTSVEVTLLRIAQSALANVRQHSAAELVRVVLAGEGDRAVLQISDDGRGFDTTALEVRTRSYGLIAMRSRLRELGGELRIDSAPGEGTTVRAEVGR
ncbi:histidine kinase [Microbacterium esteraromaticum]|uniref:histidine kinase n=1 Tax=Microbacterium esteraromaticum TaxID=57043 RepID=UPI0019571DCE|nr:signal transduction histidine kinase [Microbacterium esteraromaticum]